MRWTEEENFLYAQFLENNRFKFKSEFERRKYQVFTQLSSVLKSKTQKQCKSHHQKMMFKYHNI